MIGADWLEYQYRLILLLVFLSLFCNSVLFVLIHLKSPKKLGPYKYLMNFITLFEICYSIIDFLSLPVMHSHGSSFYIMTPLSHSFFEKENALKILAVWCGFFGSSMAIFGIHFIYRYFAVSGSELISTFKGKKIIFWMLIPFIYGTVWATVSFFSCRPKVVMTNYIRNNLMEDFKLSTDDIVYLGPYFYSENGDFLWDQDVIITLIFAMGIMGSSVFTIFYFGWKCYKSLSNVHPSTGGFSKQYRALQKQFFIALVLQTIIPITLMHLPLLITYSGALLNHGLGRLSNITSITIALYPVIDPLPTIFIVKNYREGLKRFCLTPVRFCIANKNSVKIGHVDDAGSRRTSKLPDDDKVSVWGEIL